MNPVITDDGRVRVDSLKTGDLCRCDGELCRRNGMIESPGFSYALEVLGKARPLFVPGHTLATPLEVREAETKVEPVRAFEVVTGEYFERCGDTVYRRTGMSACGEFVLAMRDQDGARANIPRLEIVTPLTMTRPAEFRRGR